MERVPGIDPPPPLPPESDEFPVRRLPFLLKMFFVIWILMYAALPVAVFSGPAVARYIAELTLEPAEVDYTATVPLGD